MSIKVPENVQSAGGQRRRGRPTAGRNISRAAAVVAPEEGRVAAPSDPSVLPEAASPDAAPLEGAAGPRGRDRGLEQLLQPVEGLVEVSWPTYDQVLEALQESGSPQAGNWRSAFARWMEQFERFGGSDTGLDFHPDVFPERLTAFELGLYDDIASASVPAYLSRIRRVQELATSLAAVVTHGLTLSAALQIAMEVRGRRVTELARAAGVPLTTLQNWLRDGQVPERPWTRAYLAQVEHVLELPAGTLTRFIPPHRQWGHFRTTQVQTPFGRLVDTRRRERKLSVRALAELVGVTHAMLRGWLRPGGTHPLRENRRTAVPKIAAVLDLEIDVIEAAIGPQKLLTRDAPYYLYDLPPLLEAQWGRLLAHKTRLDEPDPTRRPNEYWKVRGDGYVPSARRTREDWGGFFGWLTKPPAPAAASSGKTVARAAAMIVPGASAGAGADHDPSVVYGLGLPLAERSVLDLADRAKVEAFVQWRARRTSYNGWTTTFVGTVTSLLRPETGWLWQAHDIDLSAVDRATLDLKSHEAALPILDAWRLHCERTAKHLRGWLKHLTATKQLPKDGQKDYAHIKRILDAPRPMDVLRLLMERMRQDFEVALPRLSDLERASFRRDLLLITWFCYNPLRLEHWVSMLLPARPGVARPRGAAPEGHLRRNDEGRWVLFYAREEFKALADIRDHDYEVVVPDEVVPLLDAYLAEDRPLLAGAETCDFVFRPGPRSDLEENRPQMINLRVKEITRQFLPDYAPQGFRPHAFRHIIATHLVKNYDDGIQRASDALHNTEAMIRRHYGHLRSRDRTRRAHEIISTELAGGRRGSSQPGGAR